MNTWFLFTFFTLITRWNKHPLYPIGIPSFLCSPVQNWRKFSAVFGHTSRNSWFRVKYWFEILHSRTNLNLQPADFFASNRNVKKYNRIVAIWYFYSTRHYDLQQGFFLILYWRRTLINKLIFWMQKFQDISFLGLVIWLILSLMQIKFQSQKFTFRQCIVFAVLNNHSLEIISGPRLSPVSLLYLLWAPSQ